MAILKSLLVVQSIFINFKLCSSTIYLKPDDDFELRSSELVRVLPRDTLLAVLRRENLKPADNILKVLDGEPIAETKLTETDREITNLPKLFHKEINYDGIDESDLNEKLDDSDDISDLEIDDLNLNIIQKNMLRKRWRSSCDKKAAKTCTTACKNAYKIVCSSFKCKSRMKRDFKKECKRNCKSKFIESVSSRETE